MRGDEVNMHVLFTCMECNRLLAWPDKFADGHSCSCGGYLKPIDRGTQEELWKKYFPLGHIDFHNRKRRVDGLTQNEGEVMDALINATKAFVKLESQHPDDASDFINAIHRCQDLLAVRIARREYPKGWPIKKSESNRKCSHCFPY